MEAANRFLDDEFLVEFNARFEVVAAVTEDWHRPLSAGMDLSRIVSIQELAGVVAKDWTLRWRNRVMQLPLETAEFIRSGQRVTVCEPLDGVLPGVRRRTRSGLVGNPEPATAQKGQWCCSDGLKSGPKACGEPSLA